MIREEADRTLMGDAVIQELRQFHRLCAIIPPLTCEDIAHRMAWSKRNVRWLLRKLSDNRP